jgi:predicted Mrr-cat superfamily restriction endonuclease
MTQRLRVAVWTDEDILDHLFASYQQLSDEMRAAIPLKHAWVLVAETG